MHNNENITKNEENKIAIYHLVKSSENFEESTRMIFELLKNSQEKFPNNNRSLFLDIEGHRNNAGGFNGDMMKLQKDFLLDILSKHFKLLALPLGEFSNNQEQDNNISDDILQNPLFQQK